MSAAQSPLTQIVMFSVSSVADKVQSGFLVKQEARFYLCWSEQLLETETRQRGRAQYFWLAGLKKQQLWGRGGGGPPADARGQMRPALQTFT